MREEVRASYRGAVPPARRVRGRARELRGRVLETRGSAASVLVVARGPEPRRFLQRPDLFGDRGKNDPLPWDESAEDLAAQGELAAAYFQHLVVFQLKRALEDRGESVEDLARRLGVTAETLRRKFRGEDRASLEDMLAWSLEYGIDLLPVIENRDDLLP